MGIKDVFLCETPQDAFVASAFINAVCVGVAIEVRQLQGDATIMPAVVATCFVSYILVYMGLYKWAQFGHGMVAPPPVETAADSADSPKVPAPNGLRSFRLIT